jgi:hypothetical protein
VGPAIAGGNLKEAASLAEKVTGAVRILGSVAGSAVNHQLNKKPVVSEAPLVVVAADGSGLEALNNSDTTATVASSFDWGDAAVKTAQAAAVLVGTVGIFASGAAVIVPIAVAAANALPEMASALTANQPQQQMDFVEEVAMPMAKALLFTGASVALGNIVRFNVVKGAFNRSVDSWKGSGQRVDGWLPSCMQGSCEKIGHVVGWIDGGRQAMKPEVHARAEETGQIVQKVFQCGLTIADEYSTSAAQGPRSWADTARKVAYTAGALAAGAGLVCLAPEVAAVTGATTLLSVAGKAITYLRSPVALAEKAELAVSTEQMGVENCDKLPVDLSMGMIIKPSLETEQAIHLQREELTVSAAAA